MKGLTYSRCGDYYIPDLKLSEQVGTPVGKYGRMRKQYLEKHRPILICTQFSGHRFKIE